MKRLLLVALFAAASSAQAQDSAQLSKISQQLELLSRSVKELQSTVHAQNERIAVLEKENTDLRTTAASTASNNTSVITPVTQNLPSGTSGSYVPDIGIVGDIVGTSSDRDTDEEGNDRFSVRELELVLGHDIDPYSRFDATITFSDQEDPEIEEAYVSYWGLLEDTKFRLGRVRPRIDITSAMHRDALETVDEPLVIQNYLGIEGLFKTGLEVSNYLPLPWENVTHEAIFGMMEGGTGEDGTMFGTSLRRQTYFGRLKNFWEISDHSSAQLGTTYMLGSSNDEAVADVHAVVTDFVYTHKFNSEEKLTLKSEAIFQNRSQGVEQSEESDTYGFRHSPWGMYSLAEYRFAPRWAFGGRWDYVQPIDLGTDGSRAATIGWNTFLTFYQSEFARWRFQYEHVNNAEESSNNIFFLQGTFAIGTHKHALQ